DCGYCTFRRDPGQPGAHTMTPEEVIALCRAGARLGAKEALFSLGDRPEARFAEHREFLKSRGHRTTLSYVREVCATTLAESGLLPHVNPGLMAERDLAALREVSVSMGLMLETTSERLLAPGGARRRAGRHPRSARTLRPRAGSHRAKLPRQAVHSDARRARAHVRRAAARTRGGPARAAAGCRAPGAAESQSASVSAAARRRPQRLGRHLAADARSHQSREAVARPRRAASRHRERRLRLARATRHLPERHRPPGVPRRDAPRAGRRARRHRRAREAIA